MVQLHSFACDCSVVIALFTEKTLLLPLRVLTLWSNNQLITDVRVYLWTPSSILAHVL